MSCERTLKIYVTVGLRGTGFLMPYIVGPCAATLFEINCRLAKSGGAYARE